MEKKQEGKQEEIRDPREIHREKLQRLLRSKAPGVNKAGAKLTTPAAGRVRSPFVKDERPAVARVRCGLI